MKMIDKQSHPGWTIPVFLAVLCVLSFGVFIPFLGFYWDDWAKILVYRLQGWQYYWPYYVGDRPLSGWTHIVLTPLLGVSPVGWQIFTLGMRFLSACGIYAFLNQLRPRHQFQSLIAAAIFTVYPLFGQQAIAVTLHQQWMQYAFIIWSFFFMLKTLDSNKHPVMLTTISIVLSILQLTITEYFAPLELLRPFLLWFKLPAERSRRRKILNVLKHWSPYLAIITAFFIIRVFFMPFAKDDPYRAETLFNFFTKPVETITWVARILIVDLSHIFVGNWSTVLDTRLGFPLSMSYLAIFIGSILVGIGAAFFFKSFSKFSDSEGDTDNWSEMAVVVGLAGALIGPIPAWITQRQVLYDFHSDRYALPAILGLSILSAGVINWLGRTRIQKAVLAGLIISLGCGYQLRTANDFRAVWDQEMRLYWQLYWRAPQLKAPTAIYSENELIPNQGLFSMSGALNQLYPQHTKSDLLDYWFYTLLPKYEAGPPAYVNVSNNSTFRTLHFMGDSPNTLLIHQDPAHGNCLWMMRPEDKDNPYLSDLVKGMLSLSNLERIEPYAVEGYPPRELFGTEPAHDWCYLYQKADLAWQLEDWDTIVQLGETAKSQGLSPVSGISNSPREWWPFISGYAHAGQVREAITLSQQSIKRDKKYHTAICNLWRNMQDVPDMGVGISELGCAE
jgi:hypothetical protein